MLRHHNSCVTIESIWTHEIFISALPCVTRALAHPQFTTYKNRLTHTSNFKNSFPPPFEQTIGDNAAGRAVGRANKTKLWKQEKETAVKVREYRGRVRRPRPGEEAKPSKREGGLPPEETKLLEVTLNCLEPCGSQINVEARSVPLHAVNWRLQMLELQGPNNTVYSCAEGRIRSWSFEWKVLSGTAEFHWLSSSFRKCLFTVTIPCFHSGKEGFLLTWFLLS